MKQAHIFNLVAGLFLAVLATTGLAANGKFSEKANAHAQANRPDMVHVIVTYKAMPDQAEADRVKGLGGQTYRSYGQLPMRAMRIPEHALDALVNSNGVEFVTLDAPVSVMSAAAKATANLPDQAVANGIYRGSGVTVAVLDSGVADHPDLTVVQRVHLTTASTVQNQGVRHDDSVQALYVFDEAAGSQVFDHAPAINPYAQALDLAMESASGMTWDGNSLQLQANRVSAPNGAQSVYDACTASNAISVEAWVSPGNTSQGGPARIITYSANPYERNFTLAQDGSRYIFRLRTTRNGSNGLYTILSSPSGSLQTSLQHVVAVRDAGGNATLYIDGVAVDNETISGNFSNWDSGFGFALGNEFNTNPDTTARNWEGNYHMAAVHCRALSADEVADHYAAGSSPFEPDHDPLGHGTHVAGTIAAITNNGYAVAGVAGGSRTRL